jgi:hypothetical protein
MPSGPTTPCSLASLLTEFRPCFTAPTFQTFIGLVVGLIAQTRRRTVCGMFTGAGLDQIWHHSRAHRLFTNARDLIHKSPAEFIDADSNEHLGEPRRGIYLRERACHA